MGAPTWPTDSPTSERMSTQLTEDEVERAYLRDFLFGTPPRQLGTEDSGTALYRLQRRLEAWLRMVSSTPFELTGGSPSGTDLQRIFVPPALPLPVRNRSDAALYRIMGLIQLGLIEHGFLQDRALLGELYRDWTLRSAYHILAAQWILEHYISRFPGIENDRRQVRAMESAGRLRVNLTEVPRDGIPSAFTPLYDGLTLGLNWNMEAPDGESARQALSAVRRTPDAAGARLVVVGQARKLRDEFMRRRLGPPPLPEVIGLIRPEWILGEEARQQEAGQDWREGQLPLRRLKQAIKDRKAGAIGSRLREKLRQKMALPPEESIRDMPAYGPARDAARAAAIQTKRSASALLRTFLPSHRAAPRPCRTPRARPIMNGTSAEAPIALPPFESSARPLQQAPWRTISASANNSEEKSPRFGAALQPCVSKSAGLAGSRMDRSWTCPQPFEPTATSLQAKSLHRRSTASSSDSAGTSVS